MRIMLTGANGQVGWELARSLMPLGVVIALNRSQCDLSRPETMSGIVQEIKPDVIVNAAAYTAVDKAEEEEVLATTINGTAVGVLAEEARKRNALFIHYSTDYVFDGTKPTPYTEVDAPNPINAYGRSKLAGEEAICQVGGEYLIFRTTWVYAARGHNFVKTILRLAGERDELNIVDDQRGSPTWARNIADATALMLAKWALPKEGSRDEALSGIYNLIASGNTTWFGLAGAILQEAACRNLLSTDTLPKLNPIPTSAYHLPASRPKNSCLDGHKLSEYFGLKMPGWREAVAICLNELQ